MLVNLCGTFFSFHFCAESRVAQKGGPIYGFIVQNLLRGEREGPTPQAWEGEVGDRDPLGIPHLTPALSAPRGGEGDAISCAAPRPVPPEAFVAAIIATLKLPHSHRTLRLKPALQ
jgi:hypothetical protein